MFNHLSPTARTRPLRRVLTPIATGTALVALAMCSTAQAQVTPAMERLARQLETQTPIKDAKGEPPKSETDTSAPSYLLPAQIAVLQKILASAKPLVAVPVRATLASVQSAWAAFRDGSGNDSLGHLDTTLAALGNAQASLVEAIALANDNTDARLRGVQQQLSLTSQRIARDVNGHARAAGVSEARLDPADLQLAAADAAVGRGDHVGAAGSFALGLSLSANTLVFDIARFEANIHSAFDSKSVGHSYAISFGGQPHSSGKNGQARTAADAPATAQSPTKEMHVASVSKSITAILVMKLLADKGLSAETAVAPYLPSDWTRGAGVELLTFKSFMTHRSGIEQNGVQGSDYASLRAVIAKPVGSTGFQYNNANYGMLRVLAAGLLGIDPVNYAEFDAGSLTAAAFIIEAQTLYSGIGVSVDCGPADGKPTIQYRFPDTGNSGYAEPPRGLTCGGYGWHISAREITSVMANLRYSTNLVPTPYFTEMKADYLGFMNPAQYGSFANGKFGVYFGHGGDWSHGNGGLDSCYLMFPIVVEAAVLVNSNGGSYGPSGGHQCTALKESFDNAWVPK
ncbi:MAG TPA: serine hydrolase domain-containing protein [Ideonella sp.]|nr:serine hydrolase domain-containing protein [Ideonella sp.]